MAEVTSSPTNFVMAAIGSAASTRGPGWHHHAMSANHATRASLSRHGPPGAPTGETVDGRENLVTGRIDYSLGG
jgi:hypothetical protein